MAFWKLQRLRSEELPDIAAEWLASGLDSPSLRELAGSVQTEMADVAPLFNKAIAQLNLKQLSKDEALMVVAKQYSQQIVDGQISPLRGAKLIWWEVANQYQKNDCPGLLLGFVGAASEIEDLPMRALPGGRNIDEERQELEEVIVRCARDVLGVQL